MKKTRKTILTAAAFAAAMNMTAASGANILEAGAYNGEAPQAEEYDPSEEEIQDVYGPAPDYDVTTTMLETTTMLTTTSVQTVYGPPWMFTTTTEDYVDVTTTMPAAVYGPPVYTGDLNYDGLINALDEIYMRQMVLDEDSYNYLADFNRDGKIDVADLVSFRKFLLGKKDYLDTEEETTTSTTLEDLEEIITTETTTALPQPEYGPPEWFQ